MKFEPNLSPQEILKAGAFGGCYFGVDVEIKTDFNYPTFFDQTLEGIDPKLYLSTKYNKNLNRFKTAAGLPYEDWKTKGWIHPDDPYGWFEWYLKYDAGREHSDDERQIKRWNDFCGPKGRWRRRIYQLVHERGDWNVSPRIQQSLLHWGYQINRADYEEFLLNSGF